MADLILDVFNQLGRLALFVIAFTYASHISSPVKNNYLKDGVKGLLFGALLYIAMIDPLKIAEGAVFDMRGGPAILSGILGGPIAALITALIGGYVRYSVIGGPIALGGAVSFALYAAASIAMGYYIRNRNIKLSIKNLALIGCLAFVSVLPAFFISVDVATGIAILKKAGLLIFTNNVASTLVVGFFVINGARLIAYSQRMEKDLKHTARLARIAAETTNGVIITDNLGRVEWVNKGFEQISGYSLDDMLGKKPGHVLQGPETDTETASRISTCLAKGEGFYDEILNYKKTGQPYWVSIDCQHYLDTDGIQKFMSIQTDITEKKAISDTLLAKQKQLELALEYLPGALVYTDADHRIILCSSRLAELYDAPKELLEVGACYEDFIKYIGKRGDFGDVKVDELIAEIIESLSHPSDKVYFDRLPNGDVYGIRRTLEPSGATVTAFTDFTTQVKMTDELAAARSLAEGASNAKSAFLAAMSHEIRTPMTAIIGFSELLLARELDTKTRDEVSHIKSSADALMVLINDILDLSKLEAGKYELDQLPFSPAEVLDTVADLFRGTDLAVKRGEIALNVVIDADAPDFASGDQLRLRQVLLNLTGNALKFTETGSVTIHYGIDADDAMLRFEVIDSGIGIESKVRSQLFEDFTQADSSINRKYQGTGLGLAICKRLVTLMGGSIGVESKLLEGSRFWFKIPYHQAVLPDPITEPVAFDDKPEESALHKPLSILVADDSLTNQMLIKAILTSIGHKTTFANNGVEAVEAIKKIDFDLILMDVRMPKLSGPDATKIIRKLPEPKGSIPIVAVTADLMKENRESYFEAGMNECVGKPINRESLAKAIETWARKDS